MLGPYLLNAGPPALLHAGGYEFVTVAVTSGEQQMHAIPGQGKEAERKHADHPAAAAVANERHYATGTGSAASSLSAAEFTASPAASSFA